MRHYRTALLILTLAALAAAGPLEGQDIIKRMKERTRQQARDRADRAADEVVDSAANKIERAARCLISDVQCIKAAQEAGQPVVVTAPDGQPVSSEDSAAAVAAAGGAQPVESLPPEEMPSQEAVAPAAIASADFSQDAIGAPPQTITVNQGTFTVEEHEVEGGRWLTGKERGGGSFFLGLPDKLAAAFTLTFDFLGGGGMIAVQPSGMIRGAHAMVETSGVGFINDGATMTKGVSIPQREDGVVHHARVVGRDSSMTLYIDDTKVAEATSAALARRGKRIAFGMSVYGTPVMIGSIRVTEGAE